MRIDLHTHSSASDGTDPPREVMRRARAAGVDVVALTDHDTVAGHEQARREAIGVTFVPGMELSCRHDGRSLHLLAYLFDPDYPQLAEACAAIRDDRMHRARAMVGKLADLGVAITWEQVTAIAGSGVVGRPHIARAMVEAGVITDPARAFSPEWIGHGGRAYVDRYALDPLDAVRLVHAAGGVAVLAHPGSADYRVPDELIGDLAVAGLDGLEVWHPEHDAAERTRLTGLAAALELVPTGGSDDHGQLTGRRLGCDVTPADSYRRLLERAVVDVGETPTGQADGRATKDRR